jgi:multicomponent Na+:H+ antiporter subunit A
MGDGALWPLAPLLLGTLLQFALAGCLSRTAKGWLALASGVLSFAGALALVPAVATGRRLEGALPGIGLDARYAVDGLSLVFALMATGIGAAILLYCVRYMAHEAAGLTRFYALMLVFIAGLVGLAWSADLLLAYASWEVIGLCSYFLVGFWYRDPVASHGARKVLVLTHLPGYGLLAGILVLHQRTGSFLWTDAAVARAFTTDIFLLMLLAAMAKSVMVPPWYWRWRASPCWSAASSR